MLADGIRRAALRVELAEKSPGHFAPTGDTPPIAGIVSTARLPATQCLPQRFPTAPLLRYLVRVPVEVVTWAFQGVTEAGDINALQSRRPVAAVGHHPPVPTGQHQPPAQAGLKIAFGFSPLPADIVLEVQVGPALDVPGAAWEVDQMLLGLLPQLLQ
jgi:hypothetical protein